MLNWHQYNQSMVYAQNLTEMFKKLYETELENCSILSKILIKMGGDNKYYSCSRKFLSGYNVDYVKNFSKIFLTDIELLEVNIIELKGLILKIENSAIKNELTIVLSNKKNSLKILKENYFKNNLIN